VANEKCGHVVPIFYHTKAWGPCLRQLFAPEPENPKREKGIPTSKCAHVHVYALGEDDPNLLQHEGLGSLPQPTVCACPMQMYMFYAVGEKDPTLLQHKSLEPLSHATVCTCPRWPEEAQEKGAYQHIDMHMYMCYTLGKDGPNLLHHESLGSLSQPTVCTNP
jgi:hypothetical protein